MKILLKGVLSLLLACILSSSVFAQSGKYYVKYAYNHSFDSAMAEAKRGNLAAITEVGEYYMWGENRGNTGVKTNYSEAMKWYKIASDQNYPFAQNEIARMYKLGWGVEKSNTQANLWYSRAYNNFLSYADNNNTKAMIELCEFYSGYYENTYTNYYAALYWGVRSLQTSSDVGDRFLAAYYIGMLFNYQHLNARNSHQTALSYYARSILTAKSTPYLKTYPIYDTLVKYGYTTESSWEKLAQSTYLHVDKIPSSNLEAIRTEANNILIILDVVNGNIAQVNTTSNQNTTKSSVSTKTKPATATPTKPKPQPQSTQPSIPYMNILLAEEDYHKIPQSMNLAKITRGYKRTVASKIEGPLSESIIYDFYNNDSTTWISLSIGNCWKCKGTGICPSGMSTILGWTCYLGNNCSRDDHRCRFCKGTGVHHNISAVNKISGMQCDNLTGMRPYYNSLWHNIAPDPSVSPTNSSSSYESPSNNNSRSKTSTRRTCPVCNGTGEGYEEIQYATCYTGDCQEWCSTCGKTTSRHVHIRHKCQGCWGKKYVDW